MLKTSLKVKSKHCIRKTNLCRVIKNVEKRFIRRYGKSREFEKTI